MHNFDPFLAIATNIPGLLMTGFVVQSQMMLKLKNVSL